MENTNKNTKSNLTLIIKYVIGVICLIGGSVFMFIPFIPLGYILLIAGVFLLATEIPAFKKILDKLNKKDKKNRVEKVVRKVEETESKIDNIIEDETRD